MAVAHYLEALDFQKEIVKIHTIFGGKNPHPNWLVGGVPCAINVDGTGAVGAINMERLNLMSLASSISSIEFIEKVYMPDLAGHRLLLQGLALWRRPVGQERAWPMATFPNTPTTIRAKNLLLPRGAIINGNLAEVLPIDHARPRADPGVRHPLLVQVRRRDQGPASLGRRHRAELRARARTPRARKTNIEELDEGGKYSWIKAPRWKGHAMEVGPLAR